MNKIEQLRAGNARHSTHPPAALPLAKLREGVAPAAGGRHHQRGHEQRHRPVLSGNHRQARRTGAAFMQQGSADAQNGLLCHRAISERKHTHTHQWWWQWPAPPGRRHGIFPSIFTSFPAKPEQ